MSIGGELALVRLRGVDGMVEEKASIGGRVGMIPFAQSKAGIPRVRVIDGID